MSPIVTTNAILLPSNANVAGAFQQVVPLATPPPGAGATYKVEGAHFEVVTACFAAFHTSAAAPARTLLFIYQDADGVVLNEIPAGSQQASLLDWQYSQLLGMTSSLGPFGLRLLGPLAPILLFPGYTFTIFVAFLDAADQLSALSLVVQRYPTGMPASERPVAATPTLV